MKIFVFVFPSTESSDEKDSKSYISIETSNIQLDNNNDEEITQPPVERIRQGTELRYQIKQDKVVDVEYAKKRCKVMENKPTKTAFYTPLSDVTGIILEEMELH